MERQSKSLGEAHGSVALPNENASFFKKLFAFMGPGLMVSVGYMDPGNWATDIAGGSKFGYTLLSVILISNLFAIVLQYLSLKLGIVSGMDLAQACKTAFSKPVSFILWILAEIAITATDLAEVIGSAIALNLLFGIPLTIGVLITAIDVFFIFILQNRGFRWLESIVAGLILVIILCFGYEIIVSKPDIYQIFAGIIPQKEIVTNPEMLYIAIGILGATVMPHNLYLHSSIVQTRAFGVSVESKKSAIRFAAIDSTGSLLLAFFVNASILILAAAGLHGHGQNNVTEIADAYHLLDPVLGAKYASVAFGIALLAAGQNSTLTGTLAGQIVMEGFINIRLQPWLRRLITRAVAIVPAVCVAIYYGNEGVNKLLIFSQVILSLQLSFAVVPLVIFTSKKSWMGVFTNRLSLQIIAWIITIIIILLNMYLIINTFF
jgi:manganese transport protein